MKYFLAFLAGLLWISTLPAQDTTQKSAFLGVYSEQLSEEKALKLGFDNLYGSYVSKVVENSAADRAKVQPLDYIYGIDEYRTGKEQSLIQIIRKYKPNQEATLHLYRKGEKRTLRVTFGPRVEGKARVPDKCEDPFLGITAAGKRDDAPDGVTVNIIDNSTARSIGMQDGDHIVAINGNRMLDWQDISTAINALKVGDKITVGFIRNGKRQEKSGLIKSYCETKPGTATTMDIKIAPQPGEWFDRYFKKGDGQTIIIGGIKKTEIAVASLSPDEAAKLNREKGTELKAANNLQAAEFSIEQSGDTFEMEFTLTTSGKTSVRIYNEAGRLIYLYDLGNFSGDFRDEVNLSQPGTGNFYLEIQQGNKSATKKITLSSK
ncbi:MAG: PDZ domain-containing protein [Phaeodactylibacter sp.]|nr:PDZ domain-containing protein [Phaeodactylibacter sp.]MCB9050669.1 PDZ domain-containing protein [Lewinellaceae bacterium]